MARLSLGGGHIGLDIGTSAVRAAEVQGGRHPTVTRFGQVLLPHGAVHDGEVHEVHLVSEAISTLWKRAGFRSRRVRIGVANRRVVVRQIEMPSMARADLAGAIRFQAQDYIPIPMHEAVIDFEVLEELAGPEGEPVQRVLVVAAERGMVDPIVAAVQGAKLQPEALELNAYPLVRALGGESAVATEAEAIVDIGGGVTNVVIHQGGRIRFTRILPALGGDDFTQAISEQLGLDWEEAEALKHRASPALARHLGIDEEAEAQAEAWDERGEPPEPEPESEPTAFDELDTPDGGEESEEPEAEAEEERPPTLDEVLGRAHEDEEDTDEGPPEPARPEPETEPVSVPEEAESEEADIGRAVEVLTNVLQRFTAELRGSVDFYTTQAGALPLRGVVITGGGSLLGGLREGVGQALRVPVEPGRIFRRVPVGKVRVPAEQVEAAEPFLAVAVGLGLGAVEA